MGKCVKGLDRVYNEIIRSSNIRDIFNRFALDSHRKSVKRDNFNVGIYCIAIAILSTKFKDEIDSIPKDPAELGSTATRNKMV